MLIVCVKKTYNLEMINYMEKNGAKLGEQPSTVIHSPTSVWFLVLKYENVESARGVGNPI